MFYAWADVLCPVGNAVDGSSAVKRWMKGREAAEDNAMRLIPAGGPGLRARVMELTSGADENYGSGGARSETWSLSRLR